MIDMKKLGLPLMAIVPLLFSAATVGGSYATTKAALAEHEKTEKEHTKKIEKLEESKSETDVRQAVVETKLDTVIKALDRLEDHFGTRK